jgi:hypothetical protein
VYTPETASYACFGGDATVMAARYGQLNDGLQQRLQLSLESVW